MDILRKKSRTRPHSPSSRDSGLANESGNNRSMLSQTQQIRSKGEEQTFTDINQLLDIIENQRAGLEQRAEIIKQLQSDVGAMGKLLVEERSKAAQYQQMYVLTEKELDDFRDKMSQATTQPQSQPPESPKIDKKLAQENFILKTDLDNMQHQLSLKVCPHTEP